MATHDFFEASITSGSQFLENITLRISSEAQPKEDGPLSGLSGKQHSLRLLHALVIPAPDSKWHAGA